ncbi:hypothetical protein TDB9533_04592 [Thalassocella blandensis]|nr:hypothetical protein TDB9533_04592 [Thalassocella blandensis]
MSVPTVSSPKAEATKISSTTENEKNLNATSNAKNISAKKLEPTQDLWKFGSSNLRIGTDGEVRDATFEEILAETKNSPGAMVKTLAIGADTLRFDANGRYKDLVQELVEIQAKENITSDEMAEQVRTKTDEIRREMRKDIKDGIFTVNDSGQVLQDGEAIPPESVGFELTALLIESITDKMSELNSLASKLGAVDQWVSSNIGDEDHITVLYDKEERIDVQSRVEFGNGTKVAGSNGDWNNKHFAVNRTKLDKMEKWEESTTHESVFDEFAKDVLKDSTLANGTHGEELLESMYKDYEALLKDSGLATTKWLVDQPDGEVKTTKTIYGGDNLPEELGRPRFQYYGFTDAGKRNEDYRGLVQEREVNRKSLSATVLTEAKENVRSRVSTLSTVTEQLGTNFKVDNNRFNNIIEAMNSFNKTMLDSLRRFAVS